MRTVVFRSKGQLGQDLVALLRPNSEAYGYDLSELDIATNVTGVYNICEAAKELGTERVLLVSTDEVYGSIRNGSFKETDPPEPRNPYSASKAGGELIALAHHETFGTPVVITRGSNTYGPNQYPEKVMPLFITNLIEGQKMPLYKGGERNVCDWLFVDDHAGGIDTALRKGAPGQIYNIAGGNERENILLTHKLRELLGKGEEFIRLVKDRPGHDFRYSIDPGKLKGLGLGTTDGLGRGSSPHGKVVPRQRMVVGKDQNGRVSRVLQEAI